MKKLRIVLMFVIILTMTGTVTFGHQGKTDGNVGHKDNKNISGLGNYHYHCGGNQAHLHTNGVCPYSTTSIPTVNTEIKKVEAKPTIIEAEIIKINENINSLKINEVVKLTATIYPDDTEDKTITWKTSDESIAMIDKYGNLAAIAPGTVEVIASTSNGKTSTLRIKVEEEKVESINVKEESDDKDTSNTTEDSDSFLGGVVVALLGVGGYFGYKKYKKSKKE